MQRLRLLLPALWAGMLLTIALVATPAPFAVLSPADAGRVVGRMFAQEAYASLAFAVVLFLLERRLARRAASDGSGSVFSANLMLVFGTLFCTVAGYFALQPMFVAARAGQGNVSFAALHVLSVIFFAMKTLMVLTLAWRAARVIPLPTS